MADLMEANQRYVGALRNVIAAPDLETAKRYALNGLYRVRSQTLDATGWAEAAFDDHREGWRRFNVGIPVDGSGRPHG